MPCYDQASKAGHRRSPAQVICRPQEAEIGPQLNKAIDVRGLGRQPGMALKPAYAVPLAIYTRKSHRTGQLYLADGGRTAQNQMGTRQQPCLPSKIPLIPNPM
jgi:hypothetical protein